MDSLETTGTTEEAEDLKRAEQHDAISMTAKQSFQRERTASANWGVHILHIEIGFTYFAFFAY